VRAAHRRIDRRAALLAAGLATIAVLTLGATAKAQTPPLQASFTFASAQPTPGETVTFTSTTPWTDIYPTELAWDLDGDGEFDDATGQTAKRSFPAAGDYVVRLRARRTATAGPPPESIAQQTVPVRASTDPTPTPTATPTPTPPPAPQNQPPVARLDRGTCAATGLQLCSGQLARQDEPKTFDASASSDPDGSIVRYDWDLDGDGTFETATGTTPTAVHTYDRADPLTVRVRVTDDRGATAVDEMRIAIIPPNCRPAVSAGNLRATGRCFRRHQVAGGVEYRTTSRVSINGIIVTPAQRKQLIVRVPGSGAGGIAIESPSATVTVVARGNTVTLYSGPVAWKLDSSNRLGGFKLGSAARLAGLRVTGLPAAPLLSADGSSDVRFYVAMPAQFGGPTSDQPIRITPGKAGAGAAAAQPLEFSVRNAAIGPIGLKQLRVRYDGNGLWEISTSIGLPEPIPYTVTGEAGIRNGAFEYAGAGINFGTPGVGPFGPVFLQRITFRVEIKPKQSKCVPKVGVETIDWQKLLEPLGVALPPNTPRYSYIDHGVPTFALCGEVGLTGGPQVLGAAAVRLNAGLGLATYNDRPSVFRAFGQLYLIEIPLANAAFELHTDGYVKAHAKFRYAIPSLASLEGYLSFEMLKAKFNAEGYVRACLDLVDLCAGARGLVSSRGMAVCLSIRVIFATWSPGFGMRWGRAPTPYFSGCDLGPYRERIARRSAAGAVARAAGAEQAIDLPRGLPGAVIVAEGRDAPPKISVVGPNGERVTAPDGLEAVQQAPFLLLKNPAARLTQVAIGKPAAGRWRVVVEDGSSPVVSIRSAEGLEPPDVRAKVVGRGHRRAIRYRVKPLAGQKVTFVERGPSAGGRIGVARGSRGRVRFVPADGVAERRRIVALVEQNGLIREQRAVATYRAPAALRPASPRRLRAVRRGTRLRVSWKRVPRVSSYEAQVRLSDGRRLVLRTRGHAVTIPRVGARLRGAVAVRGISPSAVLGTPARARIKAGRR
jgi:PKD repeat protein